MAFTTIVSFPPEFPNLPPIINVDPPLQHNWIDGATMRVVGHPALARWSGKVILGQILKDIELEMSLRPPIALRRTANTQSSEGIGGCGKAQASAQPAVGAKQPLFPELDLKSATEIKELLSSDTLLDEFFKSTKACQKANKAFSELENQNLDFAKNNAQLAREAEKLVSDLESCLQQLEVERDRFRKITFENKALLGSYSYSSATGSFQTAIDMVNAEAEELLSLFVDERSIDPVEFLRRYTELRLSYHQRALALEKYKQLKSK